MEYKKNMNFLDNATDQPSKFKVKRTELKLTKNQVEHTIVNK